MRLYPRMFRSNNFMKPGICSSGDDIRVQNKADSGVDIVRSSNPVEGAPEPALDLAAVEECARAARTVWIASKLKSFYHAVVRKFERAGQSDIENYLAASQNLADLEERMRDYGRRRLPYY